MVLEMDVSEEYVKMCRNASEIQTAPKQVIHYILGNCKLLPAQA